MTNSVACGVIEQTAHHQPLAIHSAKSNGVITVPIHLIVRPTRFTLQAYRPHGSKPKCCRVSPNESLLIFDYG